MKKFTGKNFNLDGCDFQRENLDRLKES